MIGRRTAIGCLISICSAACVDTKDYKPNRPHMSLAKALKQLPSIKTESALIAAFGPPDFSVGFLEPVPGNHTTRSEWKEYYSNTTPADLIEALATDAKLDAYRIVLFDSINPWKSFLYVALDKENSVVGWMHLGEGHEKDMMFDHSR